jgi:hypothetical protein
MPAGEFTDRFAAIQSPTIGQFTKLSREVFG